MTSASNITLPPNISNHGEPNLLCKPSTGYTVFSFMLANYFTHAATTQTFPGESLYHQMLSFFSALLFPAAGISRSINNIARGILVTARRRDGALRKAAAAGALCMVVRTENWRPVQGHGIFGIETHRSPTTSTEQIRWRVFKPKWLRASRLFPGWRFVDDVPNRHRFEALRHIHGALQRLPRGYAYACVPPNAVVSTLVTEPTIRIAASINSAKIIIAVFQTIFSSYTLFRARGDEIRRYGYAAFSLTVAPYVVMSVVNLLGSLLLPAYPSVFVVRSEVMDEVEHRYGKSFDGTVGALVPMDQGEAAFLHTEEDDMDSERKENSMTKSIKLESRNINLDHPHISIPACAPFLCTPPASMPKWLKKLRSLLPRWPNALTIPGEYDFGIMINLLVCIIVAGGIPLAIIGSLSDFDVGNSTLAQRIWTMTWLAFGCVYGIAFGLRLSFDVQIDERPTLASWTLIATDIGIRVVASAPAVGAMVVVGQMIMDYGDCIIF